MSHHQINTIRRPEQESDERLTKPRQLKTQYPYLVEHARRDANWIIAAIAESHNLTKADIINQDRRRPVVRARHEAIAAVHKAHPNWSYPLLGRIFERDHTTILHALKCQGAYKPTLREGI